MNKSEYFFFISNSGRIRIRFFSAEPNPDPGKKFRILIPYMLKQEAMKHPYLSRVVPDTNLAGYPAK